MTDAHVGPRTQAADAIHATKYRGEGESFKEAMNRVALGLKDSDEHYHQMREILLDQRFLPAGRVQNAIGSSRQTTAFNCFVSQTISDSYTDDPNCIMDVAKEAAKTMRMGGGIGYDFSTLRPRGALIRKLQSQSSGPVAFMQIFNAICLATASSGHRRGAQMGVMRVDHPSIMEFVRAKQNEDQLRGFNISVAVTDEFMEAVARNSEFNLRWNGDIYNTVDAGELWDMIMRSNWSWAEPGVIFIDQVNRMNNLWYCEKIAATNPCGEQPLPPHGACLLGSFNLVKYLNKGINNTFDWFQFKADIAPVVRGMDNVTDRSRYPLPQQRVEATSKRRMGLGITGLANTAEALGFAYGTKKFLEFEAAICAELQRSAYLASSDLAKEKGSFAWYDPLQYSQGKYFKTLPQEVRDAIIMNGVRNSHLTSIAPTGTISMTADNVSSGIEPVFSYSTKRPVNTPDGQVTMTVDDYGVAVMGVYGRTASEVSAREHIDVLCTAQKYMDSAVSKTCNVTGQESGKGPGMTFAEFKDIYRLAYEGGAKGCSVFNSTGERGALLTASPTPDEAAATCRIDSETGRRECE